MVFFERDLLLQLWARFERTLSTLSLIFGFLFDLFIAKRPDSTYDNLLLLGYLFVAAGCIVLLNRRTERRAKVGNEVAPDAEPLALLLILQFCFGGLASNLLVLYGHSGTLLGGLIFFGILGAMLIGNEFLRSHYSQLRFNLAVYYTLLLTYFIIAVPTFLLHSIGWIPFIISGVSSLIVMVLFFYILSGSARLFRGAQGSRRIVESAAIVATIFIVFNIFYAVKLIPPVPLSLKAIGMYHSLVHLASGYEATLEPAPWWEFWASTNSTFHTALGAPAYCFSAIFAPTGLTTPIVHQWERQDPRSGEWVPQSRVTFPITGGGNRGYFGYSIKTLTDLGQWRCNVETANGELIGRTTFAAVAGSVPLIQKKL